MKVEFLVHPSPTQSFRWEAVGPDARIGRDADNDLRFEGPFGQFVSGRHALIEIAPQGASIVDLDSTNGTFVNGRRAVRALPLNVGDRVQLGQAGPRLDVVAIDLAPPVVAAPKPVPPAAAAMAPCPPPLLPAEASAQQGRARSVEPSRRKNQLLVAVVVSATVVLGACVLFLVAKRGLLAARSDSEVAAKTAEREPTEGTLDETSDGKTKTKTKTKTQTTTEDAAPPAAPPKPPAPEPKPVDLEAAVAEREKAIFWVGAEARTSNSGGKTLIFPICTAWAIAPDRVALTGDWVTYLIRQHHPEKGIRVFISPAGRSVSPTFVRAFKHHPKYKAADAGDESSRHYNLGVAILERPVSATIPLPTDEELAGGIGPQAPVLVAGCQIIGTDTFDPAVGVSIVHRRGTIERSDSAAEGILHPRRVLRLPDALSMDGSPVFGRDGKVLGMVAETDKRLYCILAPPLRELLDAGQ